MIQKHSGRRCTQKQMKYVADATFLRHENVLCPFFDLYIYTMDNFMIASVLENRTNLSKKLLNKISLVLYKVINKENTNFAVY